MSLRHRIVRIGAVLVITPFVAACTPDQVSQFTSTLQQAMPHQDYTWQYKTGTYYFSSMKTTYNDVTTQVGPPTKEVTNVLGEKVMTYRTFNTAGSGVGACTPGVAYCYEQFMGTSESITDEVLTFNRDGLLLKMENIDKSNDPVARQEVVAEEQARKSQEVATEQLHPHRKHHAIHTEKSAGSSKGALTGRENINLQNLLYLKDLKEACNWKLSDAKEQKLTAVLADYRSRINSFDYDVDVADASNQAETNRADACINGDVEAIVDKKINFILSDN